MLGKHDTFVLLHVTTIYFALKRKIYYIVFVACNPVSRYNLLGVFYIYEYIFATIWRLPLDKLFVRIRFFVLFLSANKRFCSEFWVHSYIEQIYKLEIYHES